SVTRLSVAFLSWAHPAATPATRRTTRTGNASRRFLITLPLRGSGVRSLTEWMWIFLPLAIRPPFHCGPDTCKDAAGSAWVGPRSSSLRSGSVADRSGVQQQSRHPARQGRRLTLSHRCPNPNEPIPRSVWTGNATLARNHVGGPTDPLSTIAVADSGRTVDLSLIQRAQAGDAAAFEALVRPRLDRCFRIAWAILSSDAD